MFGFLQTVLWTECIGEIDPKCPKLANRERLPAYKAKCACGGRVRAVKRINPLRAAIAAFLVLGLTGGLYAFYATGPRPVPSHQDPGPVTQAPVKPPQPEPAISWTVDAIHSGGRSTWTVSDFDRAGNSFWPKRMLSAGDRVRLEVRHRSAKLYAFYRNSAEASFLTDDTRGRVTLPASSHWFELDGNSTSEEFVLVGADRPVAELEPMTGNFDPVALDLVIRKLEADGVHPVIRLQLGRR